MTVEAAEVGFRHLLVGKQVLRRVLQADLAGLQHIAAVRYLERDTRVLLDQFLRLSSQKQPYRPALIIPAAFSYRAVPVSTLSTLQAWHTCKKLTDTHKSL